VTVGATTSTREGWSRSARICTDALGTSQSRARARRSRASRACASDAGSSGRRSSSSPTGRAPSSTGAGRAAVPVLGPSDGGPVASRSRDPDRRSCDPPCPGHTSRHPEERGRDDLPRARDAAGAPGPDEPSRPAVGQSPGSLHFCLCGAIAQLGERLDRTQEVGGSSPPSSISKSAPLRPLASRLRSVHCREPSLRRSGFKSARPSVRKERR